MAAFSSLAPEIIREVLRYLPIRSLLDFGLTSNMNFAIQSCSLSNLRLGVFHSRLSSMISLMEATADRSCLHVRLFGAPIFPFDPAIRVTRYVSGGHTPGKFAESLTTRYTSQIGNANS